MLRLSAIGCLALVLTSSHADEGDAHRILFHRPFKPGHLFSYAAIAGTHEEVKVRWAGSVLEDRVRDLQCELAAAMQIIEADSDGMPTKVKLTTYRFGKREGTKLIPLLPKGTIVNATRHKDGGIEFALEDDATLPEEAQSALDLTVTLDTHSLDPIFGVIALKEPGDKWVVDPQVAVRRFAENGIVVNPDAIGSVVRYRGVDDVAAHKCQILHAEIRAPGTSPRLPEGFDAVEGTLEVDLETSLPLDESLPRLEEAVHFHLYSLARGTGQEAALEVETRVSTSVRTRMAKP
ncbi:MAG: hypothetical protein AAGJ79_01405 [Verrucomicrobiota bacterium]